ncbi:Eprs1 [Symbiodinium natans]|uniref:proline--tRNA ligase n=1 Tax=Symbiodinium natans TaxID=878477 RepID=A0A812NWT7_9DINO|nr:Eprs1 [Symbiodinium natans]
MDLSHLVAVGLFPAKRQPLSSADLDYFRQHGIDEVLADLVSQLAKQKPADPFGHIADAASKLRKNQGPPAAASKAAASKPAEKPKAEPQVAKAKAPAASTPAAAAPVLSGEQKAQIDAVGEELRALKTKLKSEGLAGKDINGKPEVQALVAKLTQLKEGGDAAPAAKAKAAPAPKEKAKAKAQAKQVATKEDVAAKQQAKGGGLVVKKADSVPDWYAEVIGKGQLIEKYPVKGCFILRPWAYKLWEQIQGWLDSQIKVLGVENCYFPMFIPKCYMEKESDHLDDFAPELAMVTKFGNEEIDEPVAIRPTSETAMYAAYSDWVQSHRDLPLKLNQWCSVVRWEVKQTTPFLRTREFLWQEGHTAFAEKAQAEEEVLQILELYARVYEELLAIPVVRGRKTKAETFPGADYTTTVEAFIPATGRAIQGATSHHLGQNFSKMFGIHFQDPKDPTGTAFEHAYQNSWGLTQRTIGVMVMVHGDDKGLVLPPNVAGYQVVIVPLGIKANSTEEDKKTLAEVSQLYATRLAAAGVRVHLDADNTYSPGWKFNHWEMKGVPLRIELGPLDIKKGEFVMAKRNVLDQKAGKVVGKHDSLESDVKRTLDEIHNELYSKALSERDSRLASINEWKDFSPNLNAGKLVLVPFCGEKDCEEKIKEKSKEEAQEVEVAGGLKMGAKSLCVPIEDSASALCQSRIPVQCRQGQSVFQPEWTTCLGPSQLSNASAGFAWLWI